MTKMKQNAVRNALGLGFCIAVLGFMIFLATDLPKLRFTAGAFPLIFMCLGVLVGILKLILLLTDSAALKRIDELSFIKIEIPPRMKFPPGGGEKTKEVLFFVVSIFVLLGMVYVLGFYLSSFVAGLVFTYLPSRNWRRSLVIGITLAFVSYVFSSILPGKLWPGVFFGS